MKERHLRIIDSADSTSQIIESMAIRARAKRQELQEELIRNSVSLEVAATITGSTEERLNWLIRHGRAITFIGESHDGVLLPTWQLRPNPLSPIIPEAGEVVSSFPGDLAALNQWVMSPNIDLYNVPPAEALQNGQAELVIALARSIGAAGR